MAIDKKKVKFVGIFEGTEADILAQLDTAEVDVGKLYETTDLATKKLFFGTEAGVLVDLTKGNSDAHYTHNQTTPAATWYVIHNLGKQPSVQIYDSAGSKVEGEVQRVDDNQLTVTFSSAFSGIAYCN